MATTDVSESIVDTQVVPWLRGLLGHAAALEDQQDGCWRHAYGIAQGTGFTLKSRKWPPFPTTTGSAFKALVAGDKVRRDQGGKPPTAPVADPFDAKTAPEFPKEGLPQGLGAQEKQAEQLIKGLLKQAANLDRSDACWRHAYGIAQGFGALRRTDSWPPFPLSHGSRFTFLCAMEKKSPRGPSTNKLPSMQRPRQPNAPSRPGPRNMATLLEAGEAHRAAPTMMEAGDEHRSQPTMMDAGEGHRSQPTMMEAGDEHRSQPTMMDAGEGHRSQPTMMEEEESHRSQPTMMDAGADEGGAFRAMPTMMDAGGSEGDDAGGGEAFRAMPTMMDAGGGGGDGGAGGAVGGEAFRAMPTMMDAGGSGDAPVASADDGGAFRAMPTMLEAGDAAGGTGGAPAAPAGGARPTRRRRGRQGPKLGGMREALTGEKKKAEQKKAAGKAEQIRQIGSFRVLGLLGKGAMGQVFKGEGRNGEIVAIKVLHQRFGKSKRVKARFVREAKAVERINHANSVRFFETGEQEGLGQYIAMEFVDGGAMNDLIKENGGKGFAIDKTLDYFVQTCKGMRAAHSAGVIHRDLKPENVLVSSSGHVKITDFSLARRDEDSMLLTRPGQVMGTPHFMSPEQARGEDVDARTDIYSLGAMLYTMLTGRFPFPNGTVSEVIAAHCEKPRPDPRDINKECSTKLSQMCRKLMAIDRGERYQTIDALLDELNTLYGFETEDEEEIVGALPPGTKVDDFQIERVLGAGGMGAVYQAKYKDQSVALKILPPQPGRAPLERIKDVRRFHNEAKLAKRVPSKNTYDIVKFGVDQNGQAYIAMSLEKGISLQKLITKRGFLKPALIIHVARGICKALHEIHETGIVHRDVTPANVMLRGEDFDTAADANVCLIDFGLAMPLERDKKKKNLAEGASIKLGHIAKKKAGESALDYDEDALFLEDLPGGTPAYMAPEVLEDPALVDGRADLYGLGATLYHAATGHPPYTGDSIQAVVYQQRNQAPAPITQFNADFPEELSELILQLLGNTPTFRPKSAKLCLSKLQRLEDPASVSSWRPDQMAGAEPEVMYVAAFSYSTLFLGMFVGFLLTMTSLVVLPIAGIKLPKLAKLLDPGSRTRIEAPKSPQVPDESDTDESGDTDESDGGGS